MTSTVIATVTVPVAGKVGYECCQEKFLMANAFQDADKKYTGHRTRHPSLVAYLLYGFITRAYSRVTSRAARAGAAARCACRAARSARTPSTARPRRA
eukprot:scaffold12773_cov64-Phaeocystis_antarctica.AAC.3